MPYSRPLLLESKMLVLLALLGLAAPGRAIPLTPLNYSMSANGPVFYGYDDNSYHGNGLGNPVAGALSGGVGDLANGAFGMSVAGGYWAWSPYVLWDGVSPMLTFDFGSAYHFDVITLQGISYNQAAVYSVPSASFRTSDDGVTFGSIQNAVFADVPGNDVTYAFNVSGHTGLQGRYLQIELQSPGRWIAISEIQFEGSASGPGGAGSVPDTAPTAALGLAGIVAAGLVGRRFGALAGAR